MDVREKSSNEKRLVDANELKKKMCFKCNDEYSDEPCDPDDCVFCNAINDAQTIDAVSVVRCRECVGRPFWEEDHNGVPVCLLSGLYVRSEDDFCSYGESKEGAD